MVAISSSRNFGRRIRLSGGQVSRHLKTRKVPRVVDMMPFCKSTNRREFRAEINIHFPEAEGLVKPTAWVFPEISVCLACGNSELAVVDAEVERLSDEDSEGKSYRVAV